MKTVRTITGLALLLFIAAAGCSNSGNVIERDILKVMMTEKFVPIEDSAYDSIRNMKTWIARNMDK